MADFVSTVHLLGRYPELAANHEFTVWMQVYGGQIWHETPATRDGLVTVVIQSNNRLNAFAALLRRDTSRMSDGYVRNEVVRTASFDLAETGYAAKDAALMARRETGADNSDIHAIRPVVDFSGERPRLSWEVEVYSHATLKNFRTEGDKGSLQVSERTVSNGETARPTFPPAPTTNDWLEENECHHLTAWRTLAQQMAGGATKPADQAFAIWIGVRDRMSYDATITNIAEFTWSDNLVINQNGWKGICDEWAVVQITLLRALGIPATMKFLIWQSGGQGVGHACLEWSDNGNWRHMDALWSAFDNRAIYRQAGGASNVTVMDGTSPLDSRYNGLAWGVLDVPGDQKFYPYGDFIINPAYPGNQRPGYSY